MCSISAFGQTGPFTGVLPITSDDPKHLILNVNLKGAGKWSDSAVAVRLTPRPRWNWPAPQVGYRDQRPQ
jgi:hypothetical protein